MNRTDYKTEVNTIKYIVQENCYDPQLIKSNEKCKMEETANK